MADTYIVRRGGGGGNLWNGDVRDGVFGAKESAKSTAVCFVDSRAKCLFLSEKGGWGNAKRGLVFHLENSVFVVVLLRQRPTSKGGTWPNNIVLFSLAFTQTDHKTAHTELGTAARGPGTGRQGAISRYGFTDVETRAMMDSKREKLGRRKKNTADCFGFGRQITESRALDGSGAGRWWSSTLLGL